MALLPAGETYLPGLPGYHTELGAGQEWDRPLWPRPAPLHFTATPSTRLPSPYLHKVSRMYHSIF